MEISRRTDYGVRVILDLASLPFGVRASTQDIAERQNVPAPFLAKIVAQLSLAGLVTTHRGAVGGVALARDPSQITMLQVVEALEGPLMLNRCMTAPDACPQQGGCPVHSIWVQAQRQLCELLAATTFKALAGSATADL